MAKKQISELDRKLSRLAKQLVLTVAVTLGLMFAGLYFLTSFTMSLATATGQIQVLMVPNGLKMATIRPDTEAEISVSSNTPQIVWLDDVDTHTTDLALYLPRDGRRQNYISGHEFADGSEYTSGRLLKLANGRYLQLDFTNELIEKAEHWMEHHDESEQGILITTKFSAVHLSKNQKNMCEAVFELSRDCSTTKEAILRTAAWNTFILSPIVILAYSCIFGLIALWYVRRADVDEKNHKL